MPPRCPRIGALLATLLLASSLAASVGRAQGPALPPLATAALSEPRAVASAVTIGPNALVVGGSTLGWPLDVVDLYDGATGALRSARLAQGRTDAVGVAAGGKLLVVGGHDSAGGDSAVVDIFDPAGEQWSTTTLPRPRSGMTAVAVGGRLLLAGGVSAGQPSAAVDVLDVATGAWEQATLSQPRASVVATVLGTRALLAGAGPIVDTYDAASNSWGTAQLSDASIASAATVGPRAYLLRQRPRTGPRSTPSTLDVLDGPSGTWLTLAVPGPALLLAAVGGRLLAVGAGTTALYDPGTDSWKSATLSDERHFEPGATAFGRIGTRVVGGTVAVVGSQVVFAGGYTVLVGGSARQYFRDLPSDLVEVWDTATDTWASGHLSAPSYAPAAAVVGDRLLLVGRDVPTGAIQGLDKGNPTAPLPADDINVYDSTSGAWSTAPLDTPRVRLAVAANGTLAVLAGGVAAGVPEATAAVDVYDGATGRWTSSALPQPMGAVQRSCSGTGWRSSPTPIRWRRWHRRSPGTASPSSTSRSVRGRPCHCLIRPAAS